MKHFEGGVFSCPSSWATALVFWGWSAEEIDGDLVLFDEDGLVADVIYEDIEEFWFDVLERTSAFKQRFWSKR